MENVYPHQEIDTSLKCYLAKYYHGEWTLNVLDIANIPIYPVRTENSSERPRFFWIVHKTATVALSTARMEITPLLQKQQQEGRGTELLPGKTQGGWTEILPREWNLESALRFDRSTVYTKSFSAKQKKNWEKTFFFFLVPRSLRKGSTELSLPFFFQDETTTIDGRSFDCPVTSTNRALFHPGVSTVFSSEKSRDFSKECDYFLSHEFLHLLRSEWKKRNLFNDTQLEILFDLGDLFQKGK